MTAIPASALPVSTPASTPLSVKEGTWFGRKVERAFSDVTSERVIQIAIRVLTVLVLLLGVTFGLAALLGAVAWPAGLSVFIFCLAATAGFSWVSNRLQENASPNYMLRMREESARMTLDQVVQRHGWDNLFRWGLLTPSQLSEKYNQHISGLTLPGIIRYYETASSHLAPLSRLPYRYQIPTPNESKDKWKTETHALTFEEIFQLYPVEKLEKYSLVDVGVIRKLAQLGSDYEEICSQRDLSESLIEQEYVRSVVPMRAVYDAQCRQADLTYSSHAAVNALRNFELRCMRERQTRQGQHDQQKTALKTALDQAIAIVTNQGRLPYPRLDANAKLQYVLRLSEYTAASEQLDRAFAVQMTQMHAQHVNDRVTFAQEEVLVRGQKEEQRAVAEGQFNLATTAERERREQQMEPIRRRFSCSVRDLDLRYRAYLSISEK